MSLNVATARIRGIYSTALTKLLLENGFRIADPSTTIKERFKLDNPAADTPDLLIHDRNDKQGVRVFGKQEAIDSLRKLLQDTFDDVITRKWTVSVNGIYKGRVKGTEGETGSAIVDIGAAIGIIPSYENAAMENNSDILVQVEGNRLGSKHPSLTSQIKLAGKYAIIIRARKIGVSFKINDPEKRDTLYALGRKIATCEWGIIWRSAASDTSSEILQAEAKTLIQQAESLLRKADAAEAPAMLLEGTYFMDVEFPALSKQKLDELRACVVPTLSQHHFYKANGGKTAAELELAEKLLESGKPMREVEPLFRGTVESETSAIGSTIQIQHVKLLGRTLNLGEATLEKSDAGTIMLRRVFKHAGIYDGLGVAKEPDDYAVTELQTNGWHTKTDYYAKDGRHKGAYVNINTPVEVYTDRIRYVDLEVDLCLLPDGRHKLVDMEKLEHAYAKGYISKKLYETAKNKAEEARKKYMP